MSRVPGVAEPLDRAGYGLPASCGTSHPEACDAGLDQLQGDGVEIVNLDEPSRLSLRSLPETGMGFQIVADQSLLGAQQAWLVLGGRRALDLHREPDLERWLHMRAAFEPIMSWWSGEQVPTQALRSPRVVMRRTALERGPYLHDLAEGAVPARSALTKQTQTTAGQKFYRLSAWSDDLRVEADGSLVAGTYATTATDVPYAPSGFAAVGRYALPNDQPASYRYELEPAAGTDIEIGTVAPAYGQAGGGVEVFFKGGAKNLGPPKKATRLPDE